MFNSHGFPEFRVCSREFCPLCLDLVLEHVLTNGPNGRFILTHSRTIQLVKHPNVT